MARDELGLTAGPREPAALTSAPLLEVRNLSVSYRGADSSFRAVENVSLNVAPGETIGLVGESGSGKTTIGRAILRLLEGSGATCEGRITYANVELSSLSREAMRKLRRRLQMIFQDPVSSFNPRRRIEDIVAEGIEIHGLPKSGRRARVEAALADVGLSYAAVAGRKPHQFSGGQCQRIAIARALAVEPELIVCDEPVASLDVSVQAQVINLLQDIRESRKLALIFISHDLAVVKNVSDRIVVLYMGRVVETGDVDTIYAHPAHPYTRKLLEAVPVVDVDRKPDLPERAAVPSRLKPPSGCVFRTRCPRADAMCAEIEPVLAPGAFGQLVACHHPHDDPAPGMEARNG